MRIALIAPQGSPPLSLVRHRPGRRSNTPTAQWPGSRRGRTARSRHLTNAGRPSPASAPGANATRASAHLRRLLPWACASRNDASRHEMLISCHTTAALSVQGQNSKHSKARGNSGHHLQRPEYSDEENFDEALASAPDPGRRLQRSSRHHSRASEMIFRYCMIGTPNMGRDCTFNSLQQCQATASAGVGFCQENPAYTASARQVAPQPKRR